MHPCSSFEQDLILRLYDELPPERASSLDEHVGSCPRCRAELAAFRATLTAVAGAAPADGETRLSAREWDSEWHALRQRLVLAQTPSRRLPGGVALLKAAAVILLAGASFAAGRGWGSLSSLSLSALPPAPGSSSMGEPGESMVPADAAERMQVFSERTHGYLNRSRLVLLEFANTREATDSAVLRDASVGLLRETKAARRIASQMADPRIEELLAQVESLLREISRLSDPGDASTVNRIRTEVNNSGVLDQLELLNQGHERGEQERS